MGGLQPVHGVSRTQLSGLHRNGEQSGRKGEQETRMPKTLTQCPEMMNKPLPSRRITPHGLKFNDSSSTGSCQTSFASEICDPVRPVRPPSRSRRKRRLGPSREDQKDRGARWKMFACGVLPFSAGPGDKQNGDRRGKILAEPAPDREC